jgi:hypothetical protein
MALIVLMRSTEKGRKRATFQYGTARKARATLTVIWECSPQSGSDIVLSSGYRKGSMLLPCAQVNLDGMSALL